MTRYYCQEILFGIEGQNKLKASNVTVIGVGALGTHASDILVRAGVGSVRVVDFDIVEKKNLHRQSLYSESDVGQPKAKVAKAKLSALNSDVTVESDVRTLTANTADEILTGSDLVFDCTDNIQTRYLLNAWAFENKVPWIHAAALKETGVVMPFVGGPCFECVYPDKKPLEGCNVAGINPALPPIVAGLQVNEGLNVLLDKPIRIGMLRINIETGSMETFNFNRNPNCRICKK